MIRTIAKSLSIPKADYEEFIAGIDPTVDSFSSVAVRLIRAENRRRRLARKRQEKMQAESADAAESTEG